MAVYLQSTAYTRSFLLVESSDHITGLTGATPTVSISKAGGSFAAAGGTVSAIGNGWYEIALTTTDTNTLGDLSFHITATGADPTDFSDQIVATRSGATVTNPMSSNITLTSSSDLLQTFAPNASGLTIALPDATTLTLGGPVFVLKNIALYPVQILDNAGNCVAWVLPGAIIELFLETNAGAAGTWRIECSDKTAESVGAYFTNSTGMPLAAGAGSGVVNVVQLSLNQGIVAFTQASTTLFLYGYQDSETGKMWGAQATISIASAGYFQTVPLSATAILIAYRDNASGHLFCAAISFNPSTLALTIGTGQQVTTDTIVTGQGFSIEALSATLGFVSYITSAGALKAATISISGTTVTPNTVAAHGSVTTTADRPVFNIALSSTLLHIFYYDDSNGPSVTRATVSGITVTWGNVTLIKSSVSWNNIYVAKVDSTHSAVLYQTSALPFRINSVILTDLSTISVGSESNLFNSYCSLFNTSLLQIQRNSSKYYCFLSTDANNLFSTPTIATLTVTTSSVSVNLMDSIPTQGLTAVAAQIFSYNGIFQLPSVLRVSGGGMAVCPQLCLTTSV